MKKVYIIPATIFTEATALKYEMICASMHGTVTDENDNPIGYIDRTKPGTNGDEAGVKERDGWEIFGE